MYKNSTDSCHQYAKPFKMSGNKLTNLFQKACGYFREHPHCILPSKFSPAACAARILHSPSSILHSQFSILHSPSSILNSPSSILNSQFSILTFLLLFLTSCSTSGCLENQSALPKALFYTASVSESGDVTDRIVSIDSIQVWGVGSPGDSLLVDGRASSTYLPLRSSASSVRFCFHYTQRNLSSSALNDTLTLTYTSDPRFISEECGAMYFYTVTSLSSTRHLIDSVRLTDSLVTNFDKETLRIYFRTQEADDTGADETDTETDTDPQP